MIRLQVERLSEDCATFVRLRIEDAALDYRLDPVLKSACQDDVSCLTLFQIPFALFFHAVSCCILATLLLHVIVSCCITYVLLYYI